MKTTIEIPDPVFRKAKARAAERGESLRQFVTHALQASLDANFEGARSREPKWMEGFGKLQRLRKETSRIQSLIDGTFDIIESEDRS